MESGPMQAWRSELFVTDLVKMEEIQRLEEGDGDPRIFLGGEHKHTYDSRLKRYCTEEFDKQVHFRTLRAGKVPEGWGYLVRDFILRMRIDN